MTFMRIFGNFLAVPCYIQPSLVALDIFMCELEYTDDASKYSNVIRMMLGILCMCLGNTY